MLVLFVDLLHVVLTKYGKKIIMNNKKETGNWLWWVKPTIRATQEMESRRIIPGLD
jgi:cytochrome c-type biogenesis protein CcmH/NrfF